MLVLSRQRNESIMIGDDIEITVVDIRGDKVRLGITAPQQVGVHRTEVYREIIVRNRAAAQVIGQPPEASAPISTPAKSAPRQRRAGRVASINGLSPAKVAKAAGGIA